MIQNVAALLRSLHWLPIVTRIRFKSLPHLHKRTAPAYLQDIFNPTSQLDHSTLLQQGWLRLSLSFMYSHERTRYARTSCLR
uniref:Uncharacterized protein n=1 Tax=Anguilla anguilla TaxID=7936 RepID=A0A0E9W4R0_ANGAN